MNDSIYEIVILRTELQSQATFLHYVLTCLPSSV